MSSAHPQPVFTLTRRAVDATAAVIALTLVAYIVSVALPFYANHLDRLPEAELLNPRNAPSAVPHWRAASAFGFLAVALAPMTLTGAFTVCAGGASWALARQRSWAVGLGFAALAAICLIAMVWMMSGEGAVLTAWVTADD